MRAIVTTLGLLLLAGGAFVFLRDEAPPTPDVGLPRPAARDGRPGAADEAIVRREVGTLIVRVATEAGEVPPGTEVGFEALHRETWVHPQTDGTRVFTNVPIGIVHALARAPGYEPVRQRRDLPPGVADEALLVLRRAEAGGPPER